MKIAVVTKPGKENSEKRIAIVNALKNIQNVDVVECTTDALSGIPADRVLVFGGDGTMLRTVHAIGGRDIPVLAVNFGSLGFLSSYEESAPVEEIVSSLLNGNVFDRMLLDISMKGMHYLALNEVVVKSSDSHTVAVDISIDGKFVNNYRGDGLIIATPSGSTAYNMSAGGPMLAPGTDVMVITPVCPHSFHTRPLVIKGRSLALASAKEPVTIALDGIIISEDSTISIAVTKSPYTAKFIKLDDGAFFSNLNKIKDR